MKRSLPFTFYLLYFSALSSAMPFFVRFTRTCFNGTQIGLLTGIPPLISMVASLPGPVWQMQGTGINLSWAWGILVSVLVVFLLPSFTGFVVVFGMIALFNIFLSPVASLADSGTMTMLGDERALYGRVRLGGTIGWGFFARLQARLWRIMVCGLVLDFSPHYAAQFFCQPEVCACLA